MDQALNIQHALPFNKAIEFLACLARRETKIIAKKTFSVILKPNIQQTLKKSILQVSSFLISALKRS